MQKKLTLKIIIDFIMTIILLMLMTYERIGQSVHEWLGIGLFILFILHHYLNRNWHKHIFKGKYSSIRSFQTILDVILFILMIGSMISGIILSRHVFTILPIHGGRSFARVLHMLCAYWGFICMSIHIGLHWNMIFQMIKRHVNISLNKMVSRILLAVLMVYGIYAFINRNIGTYMLLKTRFVFFDFEEPILLFIFDYIIIMGLFVFIGYVISNMLRRIGKH